MYYFAAHSLIYQLKSPTHYIINLLNIRNFP